MPQLLSNGRHAAALEHDGDGFSNLFQQLLRSLPYATAAWGTAKSRHAFERAIQATSEDSNAARRAILLASRRARATALRDLLSHLRRFYRASPEGYIDHPDDPGGTTLPFASLHALTPLLFPSSISAAAASPSTGGLPHALSSQQQQEQQEQQDPAHPSSSPDAAITLPDSPAHAARLAAVFLPVLTLAALHRLLAAPAVSAEHYRPARDALRAVSAATSTAAARADAALKGVATALFNGRRAAAVQRVAAYAKQNPLTPIIDNVEHLLHHDERCLRLLSPKTPLTQQQQKQQQQANARAGARARTATAQGTEEEVVPPFISDDEDGEDADANNEDQQSEQRGGQAVPQTPTKKRRRGTATPVASTNEAPITPVTPPSHKYGKKRQKGELQPVYDVDNDEEIEEEVQEVAVAPSRRARSQAPRAAPPRSVTVKQENSPTLHLQVPSATVQSSAIALELANADSDAFSDEPPSPRPLRGSKRTQESPRRRPTSSKSHPEASDSQRARRSVPALQDETSSDNGTDDFEPPPKRRRVGRPRKHPPKPALRDKTSSEEDEEEASKEDGQKIFKKKRDDDDDEEEGDEDPDGAKDSEEDKTEEEEIQPRKRRGRPAGQKNRTKSRSRKSARHAARSRSNGDEEQDEFGSDVDEKFSTHKAPHAVDQNRSEDEDVPCTTQISPPKVSVTTHPTRSSRRGSEILRDLRARSASLRENTGRDPLPESMAAASGAQRQDRTRRMYEPHANGRDATPLPSSGEEEDSPLPQPRRSNIQLTSTPAHPRMQTTRDGMRISGLLIKKGRFSSMEDKWLIDGLKKHGWGQWSNISRTFGFGQADYTRTGMSLKDRARSLDLDPLFYPIPDNARIERRGRRSRPEHDPSEEQYASDVIEDPDDEGEVNDENEEQAEAEAEEEELEEEMEQPSKKPKEDGESSKLDDDNDESNKALLADSEEIRVEEATARKDPRAPSNTGEAAASSINQSGNENDILSGASGELQLKSDVEDNREQEQDLDLEANAPSKKKDSLKNTKPASEGEHVRSVEIMEEDASHEGEPEGDQANYKASATKSPKRSARRSPSTSPKSSRRARPRITEHIQQGKPNLSPRKVLLSSQQSTPPVIPPVVKLKAPEGQDSSENRRRKGDESQMTEDAQLQGSGNPPLVDSPPLRKRLRGARRGQNK